MPRGIADVADLRLEVLQNFITSFISPPNFVLMNLFGSSNSPSDNIKWESHRGGRGMTPFVAPGDVAPQTAPFGMASHSAKVAYWKEKTYYDEEFLNNLRKPGTEAQYHDAQSRLAKDLAALVNRSNRRKEWMFAKMLFEGSFTYTDRTGIKISVDYDLPSSHEVTLATADKWQSGNSRDIMNDVIDGKIIINDDTGAFVTHAICNSTVFKYMVQDPTLQTLLQKFTFGDGDLFKGQKDKIVGANPKVVAQLLDIPNLIVYDEQYEVRANLTAVVTADSTTAVSVDSPTDFEVGGTLRFVDVSAGTYEDETIASIQAESGTVTVSTAPSTSYKAGEDYVRMTRKFVPDTKFVMFAKQVDGQDVAEYKKAPFGLGRHYGNFTDRDTTWDPEGVWVRTQDKGLPVLYQRDCSYILTIN